jgi:hypothetical protein
MPALRGSPVSHAAGTRDRPLDRRVLPLVTRRLELGSSGLPGCSTITGRRTAKGTGGGGGAFLYIIGGAGASGGLAPAALGGGTARGGMCSAPLLGGALRGTGGTGCRLPPGPARSGF